MDWRLAQYLSRERPGTKCRYCLPGGTCDEFRSCPSKRGSALHLELANSCPDRRGAYEAVTRTPSTSSESLERRRICFQKYCVAGLRRGRSIGARRGSRKRAPSGFEMERCAYLAGIAGWGAIHGRHSAGVRSHFQPGNLERRFRCSRFRSLSSSYFSEGRHEHGASIRGPFLIRPGVRMAEPEPHHKGFEAWADA